MLPALGSAGLSAAAEKGWGGGWGIRDFSLSPKHKAALPCPAKLTSVCNCGLQIQYSAIFPCEFVSPLLSESKKTSRGGRQKLLFRLEALGEVGAQMGQGPG